MRSIVLVLFACVCFSSVGCASGIASLGEGIGTFQTRAQVDAWFGKPDSVEETKGGFEATYTTRKKIRDSEGEEFALKAAIRTYFLSEPFLMAYYSADAVYKAVVGKEVTFIFDKEGLVNGYDLKGHSSADRRVRSLPQEEKERKLIKEEAP